MKKTLIAIAAALVLVGAAQAQHRPGHGYGHRFGPNIGWVVPALITGAIVYSATRPAEAAPVVVSPAPMPLPAPVACPVGQAPTYTTAYYQDNYGRYVGYWKFVGCVPAQRDIQ